MTAPKRTWLEASLPAPDSEDAAALLADALLEAGSRAVEERGGRLVVHVDVDAGAAAARRRVEEAAAPWVEPGRIAWREVPDEEWAEVWKKGLSTRRVSRRIVVTPSWIPFEGSPGEVVLVLDPGMAFGTAEHGTTRGALRLLDASLRPGERVADIGSGSGILAMAASRLGAGEVVAVEGDPLACEALRDNLVRNGCADGVRLIEAWADAGLLARLGPLDGIVANIETGVLLPLLSGFLRALRPGGWLILSGILEEEWGGFANAVERTGFSLEALDRDGEWCSARFRTPA